MNTQETPEPPRQRRRQLTVLLVTAGVLAAGGGGAYFATSGGGNGADPSAAGRSSPPPLELDGFSLEGDTAPTEIAPGEPGGRTYRATGELPDGPGSAPVRRLTGDVTRAEVAALAKALDTAGKPRHDNGRWQVSGAKDGSGPVLTVGDEKGAGTWSFTRYAAPGGKPCVPPMPLPEPKSAGSGQPSGTPGQDCPSHGAGPDAPKGPDSAGGDPVSEKRAKQAVRSVLPALDVAAAGAALDASATRGALRTVVVRPQVAGMPAHGWTSSFTVGSDGAVVRGHGHLGEFSEGPRYPVMSAERTLKQLNELGTPPPDDAGRKPAAVTGAEFGLTLRHSEGEPVLVPSWIYRVEQRADAPATEVTHPAVDPKLIESSTAGESGSDPGDTPTGAPEGDGPVPGQQPVSYRADGSTLKVTFWGGVCHTYKATAEESAKKVAVGIEAKNPDPDKVCIKIAKKQTVEVELDKPLGDREVVDARKGEPLPRKN